MASHPPWRMVLSAALTLLAADRERGTLARVRDRAGYPHARVNPAPPTRWPLRGGGRGSRSFASAYAYTGAAPSRSPRQLVPPLYPIRYRRSPKLAAPAASHTRAERRHRNIIRP